MKPAEPLVLGSSTNHVLRNTYWLLALTLGFGAAVTAMTAALQLPPLGIFITLLGYLGLLFVTVLLRNNSLRLVPAFALTSFNRRRARLRRMH